MNRWAAGEGTLTITPVPGLPGVLICGEIDEVTYGDLVAVAVAGLTGAFVNPGRSYLQSTGFVLDPSGRVVVSVYSSGAIGRLVPDDIIGMVRYLREHADAALA